jgi:hypothetical protein
MATTILFAFAFIGLALLAYYLFPDVVSRWFNWFTTARQAVWGPTLIIVGGFIIVAATLTLVIEDPFGVA